jgi:phosphoribosylformylglycinamidine synthase
MQAGTPRGGRRADLGICRIPGLCEAGNARRAHAERPLTFVSRPVWIRVERSETVCTNAYPRGTELRIPVAHGDGRYVADADTLRMLEAEGRVVLSYVRGENPNGSVADIAGVCNPAGTVVGFMPHPERASEAVTGSDVGAGFFRSLVEWACRPGRVNP